MLLTMMKTTQIFGAIILCSALFCGCKHSSNTESDMTIISFDTYRPRPVEADKYFSDIRIIPLETNDEGIFPFINRVELVDSLLIVCGGEYIGLFNLDGKFITRIGQQGRGPVEYSALKGFFVDKNNETVSIIDDGTGKIITYGFDGKYVSSKEIEGEVFSWGYYAMLTSDDKVLIFNKHNPTHNMAYTLVDMDHPKRVEYFNSYDPVKLEKYSYHFAQHPMARSGENIHLTMPLDHIIYEYSKGEITSKYYIETPQEIIPKERIDMSAGPEYSYRSQLVDLTVDGYFGGFTDIFETDNSIFLHYMAKGVYPGLCIINKSTNKGEFFTYPNTLEQLTSPVFPFSASEGNKFVSIVPSHQVMLLKSYIYDGEEMSDDLRDALGLMDESSNPLLVVYTIKNRG